MNKFNRYIPSWLRTPWGVAGLAMTAYVLLFAAWSVFDWGGEEHQALINDLAVLPVSLFAALAAFRTAAYPALEHRLRQAWLFFGLAVFSLFLGDLTWFYTEIVLKIEPYPSLADFFYLGFYPLLLAGLIRIPTRPQSRERQVKLIHDLIIAIVTVWMFAWYFLIAPSIAATNGGFLSKLLAVAYPIGDLILLSGVLYLLFKHSITDIRPVIYLLAISLTITLVSDLIFSYQSLVGTYESGNLVDVGLVIGNLFLGLAALRQYALLPEETSTEFDTPRFRRIVELLPTVAIILGYGLVLYASYQGPVPIWMYLAVSFLTLMVLARQLSVLRQNESLEKNLQATVVEVRRFSRDQEALITARTQQLLLAAEIGRDLSQVQNLDDLLAQAVERIRSRFDLYYAQVYLLDPAQRNLVLRVGTGQAGQELTRRGYRLALEKYSINGTAAVDGQAVVVEDTAASEMHQANPLLPETRSEMAVPLLVGERVIGVLDLQSSQTGRLTKQDLPAFEALAGQLAVAIQNASLFAEAEAARAEVEAQARRLTRQGWQDFMDGIAQAEQVGFLYEQGEFTSLNGRLPPDDVPGLVEPIVVGGETIGRLQLEGRDGWQPEETELVQAVARQAAQQIENLRLLAQAEHYRQEAEQVVRRLTRQGWQEYFNQFGGQGLGYVYDQNLVSPLTIGGNGKAPPAAVQALEVQGEAIGELAIGGMETLDEEARQLVATVASQLSTHLEELRLLEETRLAEEQATKFRLGIDHSTDAVFITDLQGTITYANPAFESVYGYSPQEVIGKTPRVIKSGVIPQERYGEFWGTLLNKQVVAGEIVNKAKDGRLVPIEGMNSPILDEGENIVGFLAVHRDITGRKQAEETLKKRAMELATVAHISTGLSATLNQAELLQQVVDQTKEQFGLYHAHIYLLDPKDDRLILAAGAGEVGRQMVEGGWNIPLEREQSLVGRAARTRQAVIVNDVQGEPGFLPNALLPETRAEMALPLVAGEHVLGVLDVQSQEIGHFTQEDVNIQTALAAQVATAIQNARQFEKTQAALAQTEALYAITQAATRTLELEESLALMLNRTLAAAGLEAGLVSIVDPATDQLKLTVHENLPEALVRKLSFAGLDGTLCDLVYRRKTSVTIEDLHGETPVDVSGLLKLGLQSYQGVPLEAKGKLLGTLCAFGFQPHGDLSTSLALMQAAGQQIGIAIENAQLFRKTQKQAEHEALINTISQKIQATTSVENALQVAVRELGRAVGAQRASVKLGLTKN